jgi:hypothetical protein
MQSRVTQHVTLRLPYSGAIRVGSSDTGDAGVVALAVAEGGTCKVAHHQLVCRDNEAPI